jgi:hypothetical protein
MQNVKRMEISETIQYLHGERFYNLLLELLVFPIYRCNRTTRDIFQETVMSTEISPV